MTLPDKKICLITGSDSGIGNAAAKALAKLGFTLLLTSRNHARSDRIVHELKAESGNVNIYPFIVHLASQESIYELTRKIEEKYNKLDILINNAGAHFSGRHLTADGIKATFAVNYLSKFLLTNLLFQLIKCSEQGRIINVTCEYHRKGEINFNDLNFSENYSAHTAMAQAKPADIIFTYSQVERLKGTSVTVNCLHPGVVSTNIIYSDPDINPVCKFLYKIIAPFIKSSIKGAETIIYLAVSEAVKDISGKYFINGKQALFSRDSYDKAIAERLWKKKRETNFEISNND